MASQINLVENLVLVFGNPYLAYAIIIIFFLYTGVKSSMGLKSIGTFLSVFSIFFGYALGNIIITAFGVGLGAVMIVGLIFDWVR